MKRLMVLCAALLCLAVAPAFAAGGTTTCTGQWTGVNPIPNNLDVPAGAVCQLNWVEVVGNVNVEGTLISFSSMYDQNINVTGAGSITIANGYSDRPIKGNVNISGTGQSGIYPGNTGNTVLGNINVTGLNNGGTFYVGGATVNGAVSVNYNFGRVGLDGLTIGKSLDCNNNTPAPASWSIDNNYGSSITATKGKTGQCAAL
jgi:hypothetical protein